MIESVYYNEELNEIFIFESFSMLDNIAYSNKDMIYLGDL